MILRRFLDGLLTVLGWLLDALFARIMLVAILVTLGLATVFLLIIWRGRARSAVAPALDAVVVTGKPDRPPT